MRDTELNRMLKKAKKRLGIKKINSLTDEEKNKPYKITREAIPGVPDTRYVIATKTTFKEAQGYINRVDPEVRNKAGYRVEDNNWINN